MTDTRRQGGARYCFASSRDEACPPQTKVCPRCGQRLFADMDVCYGCLYDFSRNAGARVIRGEGVAGARPPQVTAAPADPLEGIALDEPPDGTDAACARPGTEPVERAERAERTARAEPVPVSDTVDMDALATALVVDRPAPAPAAGRRLGVSVTSGELTATLAVPERGLSVGRSRESDIALASRSVSRRHLCIERDGEGLVARDCGARNPTLVRGVPLVGEKALSEGDELSVCGVTLHVVALPAEGAS